VSLCARDEGVPLSVLLKNAYVVTVDPDRRVIPNGWIHVEGDSIAALGGTSELGDRTADEEFDLGGVFIEANSDVAQRAVEAFLRAHSLSEPPDVALTGEAKNYITEVAD